MPYPTAATMANGATAAATVPMTVTTAAAPEATAEIPLVTTDPAEVAKEATPEAPAPAAMPATPFDTEDTEELSERIALFPELDNADPKELAPAALNAEPATLPATPAKAFTAIILGRPIIEIF